MKIKRVNELLNNPDMQEQECNFKLKNTSSKPPKWFVEFEKRLDARFNNLIKKNNLIE